jgi:hypothetical protein
MPTSVESPEVVPQTVEASTDTRNHTVSTNPHDFLLPTNAGCSQTEPNQSVTDITASLDSSAGRGGYSEVPTETEPAFVDSSTPGQGGYQDVPNEGTVGPPLFPGLDSSTPAGRGGYSEVPDVTNTSGGRGGYQGDSSTPEQYGGRGGYQGDSSTPEQFNGRGGY